MLSHLGGRWTRSVLAIPISRETSGRQIQTVDDTVSSPSSENDGLREDMGGTQATLAIMVVPLTLPREAGRVAECHNNDCDSSQLSIFLLVLSQR